MRLALALAVIVTAAAPAQLLNNPVQDYINKTTLLNNILSNARATAMSQQAQTGGAKSAATPTTPAAELTQYPAPVTPVLPKLLAERIGATPSDRRRAEQQFSSLIQLYQDTAKKDGFPANDLAYALNYFVVNTYMTVHDLHDVPYEKDPRVKRGKDMFERLTIINEKKVLKPSSHQEQALYAQFKSALAQNPSVRSMTDRQKQELTELVAILFGMNFTMYMNGVNKEDESLAAQARQTAATYLEKITGAPVARIRIDAEGLRF
ncbi:MAG TPA: DUF6683 family protein [Bryobacteraceae bacterium]|nr:DUF6683 family protein [Bryobacteraceae bacterium]